MTIDFNTTHILDGGMGTALQDEAKDMEGDTAEYAVSHPETITKVHDRYVDAGSDIIYAATFSLNRFFAERSGMDLKECIDTVMEAAKASQRRAFGMGRTIYVALDIGPLGRLVEPMGTLTFEEAYEAFTQVVEAGKDKADLIVIETMTDLYEVKAAVLAAKEHSELPVMVSMSFEENGRTFTGTSLESMAITLEGLGVSAVGINCSLGPDEILPMIRELASYTKLPVFAKPNAGLPDPMTGEYPMNGHDFAQKMKDYAATGIGILGGCCGTDPSYIEGIRSEAMPQYVKAERGAAAGQLKVCSASRAVTVDHVTPIGERLNPTGKKKLKAALIEGDYDYILGQAVQQVEAGAEILDVNVGVPQLDDVKVLPQVIKKIQSVTSAPLQIDSGNPEAIEAALRVYNGKAIVNSVNGEDEVMDAILPSVKKYGAAVVGLTLDEKGIPETAEERFAIAEKILGRCLEYGIPREDVIIDCLTLTVSAQQKEAAETLKAVSMVKERLGLKTALGVSNISFGLPARTIINRTFLTMAMQSGLDLPIINPSSEDMMASVAAFDVLTNRDENARDFIAKYADVVVTESVVSSKKDEKTTQSTKNTPVNDIFYTIENGMSGETADHVKELLSTTDEMTIVSEYLIPALDKVGKDFESGKVFLPQMIQAATAAQAGFDIIKARMEAGGRSQVKKGPVVVATVKGDIHDIGKNIVKVIMENYGFEVIDLGKDVDPQVVADTVAEKEIRLVGLSALMTTTLAGMAETIEKIKQTRPECKVWVGGAVLTADFASKIGADFYCKDAMSSVEVAQEVFDGQV